MKKLLVSLLAGAILIGVGLGVTALEISVWDTRRYPEYLEKETVQTVETEENINPQNYDKINVYVSGSYNGFRNNKKMEIVEDKTFADTVKISIEYKGKVPYVHYYEYSQGGEDGESISRLEYIVSPTYNYSLKEIREIAEDMFKNKIFYTDNSATLIEKVTVHTAYPDKFISNIQ